METTVPGDTPAGAGVGLFHLGQRANRHGHVQIFYPRGVYDPNSIYLLIWRWGGGLEILPYLQRTGYTQMSYKNHYVKQLSHSP